MPVGIGRASVFAIYANGDRDVRVAIPANVPGLNTSTGPMTVVDISAGGEDFLKTDNCLTATPLPVGASCTMLVSFKPTRAGA
jgi:hypothetical protein